MNRLPTLRFLIVEDEALITMDLEMLIEDAGHEIVGEAASLADLDRLDDRINPEVALVDLQLADGASGLEVCDHIRRRWPVTLVIFVTANPKMIPPDFRGGHGLIPKPFSRAGIVAALRYLHQGIFDPPPECTLPATLSISSSLLAQWSMPRGKSNHTYSH